MSNTRYKIKRNIERMWAPKNATKSYNYKNEEDPKDRTHIDVNKMMFSYIKCTNINTQQAY